MTGERQQPARFSHEPSAISHFTAPVTRLLRARRLGLLDLGGEVILDAVDLKLEVAEGGTITLFGPRDRGRDRVFLNEHGRGAPGRLAEVHRIGAGCPDLR